MTTDKDLSLLLKRNVDLLDESTTLLKYSYALCSGIGVKDSYTYDELDRFEALTSRFARSSDIIIQKVFRLIDIMELETGGSVIDRINGAEKRGIIESAETFKEIGSLRNDIAHEYVNEELRKIFERVLTYTPALLKCVEATKRYCREKPAESWN